MARIRKNLRSASSFTGTTLSAPSAGRPPLPVSPTITTFTSTVSINTITLSWSLRRGVNPTFTLYRNTVDNRSTASIIYSGPNTSYVDSNVTVGITYYYYITVTLPGMVSGDYTMLTAVVPSASTNYLVVNGPAVDIQSPDYISINASDRFLTS
jgi:hypothetical protein